MDEHAAAVGWLFGTTPTDRALAGWHPRVWLDLGTAVPAKEWASVLKYVPCKYGIAWLEARHASGPHKGGPENKAAGEAAARKGVTR